MGQGKDQTLPPADRATETSPQAVQLYIGNSGVGGGWGSEHQRAGGGLLSLEYPPLPHGGPMGQGKERVLVLFQKAVDPQSEDGNLSHDAI